MPADESCIWRPGGDAFFFFLCVLVQFVLLTTALAQVAAGHRLVRITRHGELVAQRAQPSVTVGRARLMLPPGAFLQATALGEETLARLVLGHVADAGPVADLFCGVGPFALRLAERSPVAAFDDDEAAVAALKQAAATTSGLKPLTTQARDLFRRPLVAPELKRFAAVVFDPPRQGAEAQARELANSALPLVIAVSCNPATFARDARLLAGGGYRLTAGHAGRSVPALRPCRDRGEVER